MAKWVILEDCMFDAERVVAVQQIQDNRYNVETKQYDNLGMSTHIRYSQKGSGPGVIHTKIPVKEVIEAIKAELGIY